MILSTNEVDEIVGAEMTFLAQEHVDNLFPLAGTLATRRLQLAEIWKSSGHVAVTKKQSD